MNKAISPGLKGSDSVYKTYDYTATFYVTKHSTWKGKYKRIFSIDSAVGILTFNPQSLERTNRWEFNDVVDIQPVLGSKTEFLLVLRVKDKKNDTLKFSCEHRTVLLTEALRYKHLFADKPKDSLRFSASKYHWSDTKLPVLLEVTASSLNQLDTATNVVLASYAYHDIQGFSEVKDHSGGFVIICSDFSRMHFFSCDKLLELKNKMFEEANYLGVTFTVVKEPVTFQEFVSQRLGKYSGDEHITSVCEFPVQKKSHRHQESMKRTLCLSETCLLERDPETYSICTLRPLIDIFSLIRDQDNPQLFSIEYTDGSVRTYTASDRDSLLATVVESVRGSGNHDVHVQMLPTCRAKRWGPLNANVEQEVESLHLKMLHQRPPGVSLSDAVHRFNSNVPYSGLLHSVTQDGLFSENKEKLINNALQAMANEECDNSVKIYDLEAHFQALRRLFASKIGFTAFTTQPGLRESIGKQVVIALKRGDEGVTHAALDMMSCLIHPMHDDYDIRQEQNNKNSVLSSKQFIDKLLDMWINHINQGTCALVVTSMLDFLTFALCAPFCETTDGKDFDNMLDLVANRGRALFRLFQHTSLAVVKGAGLVMRALIEEGDATISNHVQAMALAEGALTRHLLTALFTAPTDTRMLAHRQLSRHLVGLWVAGSAEAKNLLQRIIPSGLLAYLESKESVPAHVLAQERVPIRDNLALALEQQAKQQKSPQWMAVERQLKAVEKQVENVLQHWGARIGGRFERRKNGKEKEKRDRPVVLRKRRERVKVAENWPYFYWQFGRDHATVNLIWNHKTRDELRDALENQIRIFTSDRDLSGDTLIAWNHQEFEVAYQCLAGEIKIGEYFLRLLLEKDESNESSIERSYEFFNSLYHRFLLTQKTEMRCMCLQAMAVVYGRYHADIGAFDDTRYIIGMLERSCEKMDRDRLVMFIEKLILHKNNAKFLIDVNGIRILVDFVTLAHLHTSRAIIPAQSNVIEAGPGAVKEQKHWHYQMGSETKGPVSLEELKSLFETGSLNVRSKCWVKGMDTWRQAQYIPQIKWSILAKGPPVLNESELATRVLNILINICEYYPSRNADDAVIRPLPRVKQTLSDPSCLMHIVQLLLTFDPVLVEKVSTLLSLIMQDNPKTSTLYLTGVFYFILMYNGSNVLPIARFLKQTHMLQAVRNEDANASEIVQRSVLSPLLPEAMLHYLENHGPDKFAQIYLGEFDTPEAIWNREMRLMLIQKIAIHVAEFTPSLRTNTRAQYDFCKIPAIRYPQLERELFCNIYYLRNLCDTIRFPEWPIKDPIQLLKDVLETWKKEVEKKPPAMSVDDAYECLNLARGTSHDESTVRKAYYRLAQQFHPDKNPDGRARFEEVNEAYEFLCSRCSWAGDGPNPENIVLVLKAQSILFSRYSTELQPYKYAGYPQLIRTIQMETSDEKLFSKSSPLLVAATELAYHTVHCSALNAEELRRERGLEVLLDAFSRCVSMLNRSSKPADVAVDVCYHVVRCYTVAAKFQGCRDRMVEMGRLIGDICRILVFTHLTKLCAAATECISSLAVESILQMKLLHAGCMWDLLLFMLNYDYTLEEGGVERSEDANQQEVCNKLAKLAVLACGRLAGYLSGDLASPVNNLAQSNLETLLTPYLAKQLANENSSDLLKQLNSNWCNPYLLWNNSTRSELIEYLEGRKENKNDDQPTVTGFKYSAHGTELRVGEIYVRIYNEQPTFPLLDPKKFIIDLVEYLRSHLQEVKDATTSPLIKENTPVLKDTVMVLNALNNVIATNQGVEIQCIGSFRLLFTYLIFSNSPIICRSALEVIHGVTRCHECVEDIAATEVMGHLLLLLRTLPDGLSLTLDTLYALLTTTKLVKEVIHKGLIIHVLDEFCNGKDNTLREKAAEVLSRSCQDKLHGPKVKIILNRFLPPLIVDAMRESPSTAISLFDSCQENPELIWDQEVRQKVCSFVSTLRNEFVRIQKQNPSAEWVLPEDKVEDFMGRQELVVGGVYLRIFVENPGWSVRRPKEFLNDLMDHCLTLMSKESSNVDHLELTTNALVALLQTQPALANHVPAFGHIPELLKQMTQFHSNSIPRSAILILHQLAYSEVCVAAMGNADCVKPLKRAMQARKDMIGIACDALDKLFSSGSNSLVRQALEADIIPFLLTLLDGYLEVENAAMARAQIVKALKSMTRSPLYGERVNALLEKSTVWCQYRDQKHDLFITQTPSSNYLTGIPTTAGYLTQTPASRNLEAPPPIDKEDVRSPPPLA